MTRLFHSALALLLSTLIGCSTGPYLKPEAIGGIYSTENPACSGAEEVIEFHPTGDNWIVFRVLSKLPNKASSEGTKLIAYFRFIYFKPNESAGIMSAMFPSKEEQQKQTQLIESRKNLPLLISSSNAIATILLPNGSSEKVSLPFFERPYDPNKIENPYGIWGPATVISPDRLENFTVIFPTIYFNGEELDIPPVKFGIDHGKFAPVLNC